MKRLFIVSLIAVIALITSSCNGTTAEPTMSAQDIQSTAVSAAFTIVAETQAAIPTNTPVPPTDTPVPTPIPTDTPVPSPTLEAALIAPTFTSAPTTSGDPCWKPLPGSVSGYETKIRLKNETKGNLKTTLYLNMTAFGECGYRGYNLGPKETTIITDLPTGCYNISTFVDPPAKPSKSFGYGCINNTDMWEFQIYADYTVLVSP